jgi:hypothetical protein
MSLTSYRAAPPRVTMQRQAEAYHKEAGLNDKGRPDLKDRRPLSRHFWRAFVMRRLHVCFIDLAATYSPVP